MESSLFLQGIVALDKFGMLNLNEISDLSLPNIRPNCALSFINSIYNNEFV